VKIKGNRVLQVEKSEGGKEGPRKRGGERGGIVEQNAGQPAGSNKGAGELGRCKKGDGWKGYSTGGGDFQRT